MQHHSLLRTLAGSHERRAHSFGQPTGRSRTPPPTTVCIEPVIPCAGRQDRPRLGRVSRSVQCSTRPRRNSSYPTDVGVVAAVAQAVATILRRGRRRPARLASSRRSRRASGPETRLSVGLEGRHLRVGDRFGREVPEPEADDPRQVVLSRSSSPERSAGSAVAGRAIVSAGSSASPDDRCCEPGTGPRRR